MPIIKNKLKSKYTQIPNQIVVDTNIKAQALRMFVYICGKPDGWEVWNNDIKKSLGIKDSKSIAKYWTELENAGWISRVKSKSGGFDYELHEEPNHQKIPTGNSKSLSPKNTNTQNIQSPKNPHHSNTILNSNTESNSKKEKHGVTSSTNTSDIPNFMKSSKKTQNHLSSSEAVTEALEEVEIMGHADILAKAGEDHTQKMLFWLWRACVSASHTEMNPLPPLSVLDKTQLKLIGKKLGMIGLYVKISQAIDYWYEFTMHCEASHGAYKSPEYPTIQYVQKYLVGLNTFMSEVVDNTPTSSGGNGSVNTDIQGSLD